MSIRQAYWLVGHRSGRTAPDTPVGIVEHYTRNGPPEGWHRLWDGCRIHHGIGLNHAASKTAIVRAMRGHLAAAHTEAVESVTKNGIGHTPTDSVEQQLVLPVEPAAAEFKRWLTAQPQPEYIGGER